MSEQVNEQSNEATAPALDIASSIASSVSNTSSGDTPAVETKSETVVEQTPVVEEKKEEVVLEEKPAPEETPVIEPVVETKADAGTVLEEPVATTTAVDDDLSGLNDIDKLMLNEFKSYAANMGPTIAISEEMGISYQIGLYNAIKVMFNDANITFNLLFPKVLNLFKENNPGAFDEYHMFRFFDQIRLSKTELTGFTNLLSFLNTASKAGRNKKFLLSQVNLTSATQFGITELGRRRINTFFNIE